MKFKTVIVVVLVVILGFFAIGGEGLADYSNTKSGIVLWTALAWISRVVIAGGLIYLFAFNNTSIKEDDKKYGK